MEKYEEAAQTKKQPLSQEEQWIEQEELKGWV